ncbi:unnamed protein product [Phytomonas sp. EM1]|nr:unnamed protein product [Phytomonas sp. EM1]|eukprot:CCW65444.1 unnamed protein product [Phytomonas sp. isolate EM1]
MKYIPLPSFEAINSLLYGVEAHGCLITIRLEAFTCRHTREERQIAANLAQYQTDVQRTPPLSPSPGTNAAPMSMFTGEASCVPPPLVLGSSVDAAPLSFYTANAPTISPDDIDERLIYFVAALNSMYGKDGYDFSVLTENDFIAHNEATVRNEIQLTMQSFPESCQPAVRNFWAAIHEQVLDASQGCEVYEFSCPSCDPRAETSIFSHHYFFYNKTRKILVTLLEYAEGNRYRGDDGYSAAREDWGVGYETDERTQLYASDPEVDDESVGKNRWFYGY